MIQGISNLKAEIQVHQTELSELKNVVIRQEQIITD